jgi:hypothetical protein
MSGGLLMSKETSTLTTTALASAADSLILLLKNEGFIIQRYDAYSSNSVYLKLDYGVCNSIRISDHTGKGHLDYRYNLLKGCAKITSFVSEKGFDRHFFPLKNMDALVERILSDKRLKLRQYGMSRYTGYMESNRSDFKDQLGFWSKSFLA